MEEYIRIGEEIGIEKANRESFDEVGKVTLETITEVEARLEEMTQEIERFFQGDLDIVK